LGICVTEDTFSKEANVREKLAKIVRNDARPPQIEGWYDSLVMEYQSLQTHIAALRTTAREAEERARAMKIESSAKIRKCAGDINTLLEAGIGISSRQDVDCRKEWTLIIESEAAKLSRSSLSVYDLRLRRSTLLRAT
jgi:hypothetical protein